MKIHELAHAKLHSGDQEFMMSTEEKEFQAEMVAFSTASYFDINTSDYSLKYHASWTKDKEFEDKEKLLRDVRDTSNEFIDVIEKDLIQEKEMNQKVSEVDEFTKME